MTYYKEKMFYQQKFSLLKYYKIKKLMNRGLFKVQIL